MRLQCALTFAAISEKGATQPDWLDRTPNETARRRNMISIDEDAIAASFAGFMARTAGEDEVEAEIVVIEEAKPVSKRKPRRKKASSAK